MEEDYSELECPTCDPCRAVFDQINVRGVGFCVTCVEYLCNSCVNHHCKLKATRNHTILSGDELPDSKAPFEMLEVIGKCTDHPEQEIAYECEDHQQFLCFNCAKSIHMGCTNLKEIALHINVDSYRSTLSGMIATAKLNEKKVDALKCQKMQNIEITLKERNEILDKQRILKETLERALRDIDKQKDQVYSSFARKLEMINLNVKRLENLKDRIALHGQFAQVTSRYASPTQLYIVASGQFQDIDDLLEGFQNDSTSSKSDTNVTDIKDDMLNLLLTVDISKHIFDNSSDSVDGYSENHSDTKETIMTANKACQAQNIGNNMDVNEVYQNTRSPNDPNRTTITTESTSQNDALKTLSVVKEESGTVMLPLTTDTEPTKYRQSLMQTNAELASSHSVHCNGDTSQTPCDIAGETTQNEQRKARNRKRSRNRKMSKDRSKTNRDVYVHLTMKN